jgi:WD40 repeat protein
MYRSILVKKLEDCLCFGVSVAVGFAPLYCAILPGGESTLYLRRTSQIPAEAIDNLNMATTTQMRIRPRPAHTRGPTYLSYTPDGTKLITVGSNNTTRVYKTGFDGEPTNIDDCPEQNTGVASTVCISLPGV